MVLRRVFLREHYRIISPDNALFPYLFCKLLKCRNQLFFLIRQICLHIPSVSGQRELEIILVRSQFIKSWKHRYRILCPEHYAVHHIRREINPAYLMSVHGIPDIQESLLYSVVEPLRVKCWNISSPARTYYHNFKIPLVSSIVICFLIPSNLTYLPQIIFANIILLANDLAIILPSLS